MIITPILCIIKVRLEEVKKFAQGHTATMRSAWNSTGGAWLQSPGSVTFLDRLSKLIPYFN